MPFAFPDLDLTSLKGALSTIIRLWGCELKDDARRREKLRFEGSPIPFTTGHGPFSVVATADSDSESVVEGDVGSVEEAMRLQRSKMNATDFSRFRV